MSRSVRILEQASEDVDRIFGWLESRSPQGAATWYEAFVEAVANIAATPESYPLVSDATQRWGRKIHQSLFKTARGKRYQIIYELTDMEILILRIRGPGQPPLRRRGLPAG